MPRYVAMARVVRAEVGEPQSMPPLPYPTVFESGPVDTGLVDARGVPIYRTPDAVGFLPDTPTRKA